MNDINRYRKFANDYTTPDQELIEAMEIFRQIAFALLSGNEDKNEVK